MKSIYIFLCSTMLIACTQTTKNNEESENAEGNSTEQPLQDQVMKMHDEIMLKIEDVHKAKARLEEEITNSVDEIEDARKDMIKGVITQLDSVDQAMMDWMHQYKAPSDTEDASMINAYLEDQVGQLKILKESINRALDSSKEETQSE